MNAERLFAVKEEMDKAEARRLQPSFVRSFFTKAFESLGGTMHAHEAARFEVTHVPATIRERDRLITGQTAANSLLYSNATSACASPERLSARLNKPGAAFAAMLHPGHPLHARREQSPPRAARQPSAAGHDPRRPADPGEEPHLLFMLTHEIKSGNDQVLSKRLQFVRVAPDGSAAFAGWAPHLDLNPSPCPTARSFRTS